MFGIGPMELVVIVVVALLIFGPQKLPELARALGKGLAEFRRASNDLRQSLALDELQNDLRKTMNEATKPPPVRPAQAGDALPPGTQGHAADRQPEAAAPEAGSATSGPATRAASDDERPWKNNPGELPEGHDHDHHDPVAPERDDRPPLASADPGLGNVPVGGGADPSDPRRG
ncbi:MAG: twin-arginine translocase TatA/TatE family subunit [Myxococcota bacterium]